MIGDGVSSTNGVRGSVYTRSGLGAGADVGPRYCVVDIIGIDAGGGGDDGAGKGCGAKLSAGVADVAEYRGGGIAGFVT